MRSARPISSEIISDMTSLPGSAMANSGIRFCNGASEPGDDMMASTADPMASSYSSSETTLLPEIAGPALLPVG